MLATQPPTVAIWQSLLNQYVLIGGVSTAVVLCWLVYTVAKHRERGEAAAYPRSEENGWEGWRAAILVILIMGGILAYIEFQDFGAEGLVTLPADSNALHITVIGQQWSWTFVYPNGLKVVGNLTVPAGQTVILNITSADVMHSLAIPDLDVAKDAVPGQFNTLWFSSPSTGVHIIRCKELCGTGHAFMIAKLTVVTPSAFANWYPTGGNPRA